MGCAHPEGAYAVCQHPSKAARARHACARRYGGARGALWLEARPRGRAATWHQADAGLADLPRSQAAMASSTTTDHTAHSAFHQPLGWM